MSEVGETEHQSSLVVRNKPGLNHSLHKVRLAPPSLDDTIIYLDYCIKHQQVQRHGKSGEFTNFSDGFHSHIICDYQCFIKLISHAIHGSVLM